MACKSRELPDGQLPYITVYAMEASYMLLFICRQQFFSLIVIIHSVDSINYSLFLNIEFIVEQVMFLTFKKTLIKLLN